MAMLVTEPITAPTAAPSVTDAELLRRFVAGSDADAFGAIVGRYLPIVYASARRQVRGDAHLADDVTQAVFIVLARKARSVEPRYLAGWLIGTARLAAKSALRNAARRADHERRAAMAADAVQPDESTRLHAEHVEAIRAVLDHGLSRLNEADRTAVVLRYLRGCSMAEVGSAMGISEEAAQKRVQRSLAKLRERLGSDALAELAPSVLAPLITSAARDVAVPAHLAATSVAQLALQQSVSYLTAAAVAQGALKAMFIGKIKLAACVMMSLVVVTGLGYQGARMALAELRPDEKPAAAPDSGGLVAVLKSGVRVELVGMNECPSRRGKPWWRPDGSPLAQAPYARMGGSVTSDEPMRVAREFAVKRELTTSDGNDAAMRYAGKHSWSGGSPEEASGRAVEDMDAYATEFEKGKPATIRFEIAQGPWHETSVSAEGSGATHNGAGGLIYGPPIPSGNDTVRTITLSGDRSRHQIRAVAALTDGTERVAESSGGSSTEQAYQTTFTVPDASPETIAQFRVFTRPYDAWVEFRDVATEPGMGTKSQVVTSEGANEGK